VGKTGFAVALDIGTSNISGMLMRPPDPKPVAVSRVLNSQSVFGSDVMTRLNLAISRKPGLSSLRRAVVENLEALIYSLISEARVYEHQVLRILAVGNSAMRHLALGIDPRGLATAPFKPSLDKKIYRARAEDLGFKVCPGASLEFLPNIGGFVGSDALAVIIACGMYRSALPVLAIDIGTNGEIIIGNKKRILAASTSAGPAFEGRHISCGIPARDGAIETVALKSGRLFCRTIGDSDPKGICGSGLIDLVSVLLDKGILESSGKIKDKKFRICGGIYITQGDIRELQLAKAAIQAAVRILSARFGRCEPAGKVFLTGAFGSRISKPNAKRIGIIPKDMDLENVSILEDGALHGAGLILSSDKLEKTALRLYERITHVELHKEKAFQDEFVEAMRF